MNLPTIKQLRYFVALNTHEHFGKAAEASFVSQSALSTAIRELESVLNVQLVDRTNKNVTITNIGKEIAVQARLVLRDLESLVEVAGGNQEPLAGRLKLGVIPTIAPFLLPKVLPALRQQYPRLQLYLREDTTRRIYDRLMEGAIDLILIALPYELRNVETLSLHKDPFVLAYRRGTHLVDPRRYAFHRLQSESVLLLEDGHCLRDHAITACKLRSVGKISRFSASSLLTLIEMVDANLGITFLPEMASDSTMLANTSIETSPLKEENFREIGLAWRKGSARREEFTLLGEFFREHRR